MAAKKQTSDKKQSGRGRTRNYACTLYKDSAPENWYDILVEHKVPCFISPYHDKDFNPEFEGKPPEPKKPHWHVLIMFDGVKTKEQAEEIFLSINGVGCEPINSLRGYARYLCHLDNPEKAQYLTEEVQSLMGADYFSVIELPKDKYTAIREIIEYVRNNQVATYAELLDYCAVHRQDWFICLCDNGTYVIKEYIKSYWWSLDKLRVEKEYNDHDGQRKD